MIRIVLDTAPVVARLGEVKRRLADPTPLHKDIGEFVAEATRKRFVTGTAPDGTAWRPKSAATMARYKSIGHGNKTKPLIGPSGRLRKEIGVFPTRDQVEIGSALEYSGVMQEGAAKGAFGTNSKGAPLPWGDIPARVFLGISDTDERGILGIADDYMAAALDV